MAFTNSTDPSNLRPKVTKETEEGTNLSTIVIVAIGIVTVFSIMVIGGDIAFWYRKKKSAKTRTRTTTSSGEKSSDVEKNTKGAAGLKTPKSSQDDDHLLQSAKQVGKSPPISIAPHDGMSKLAHESDYIDVHPSQRPSQFLCDLPPPEEAPYVHLSLPRLTKSDIHSTKTAKMQRSTKQPITGKQPKLPGKTTGTVRGGKEIKKLVKATKMQTTTAKLTAVKKTPPLSPASSSPKTDQYENCNS